MRILSVRSSCPPHPSSSDERRDASASSEMRTSQRHGRSPQHLGDVRLVLPTDGARLDLDDLHEEEVLHAARVFGALVGGLDLAGDEVLARRAACRTCATCAGLKTGFCVPSISAMIWFCRSRATTVTVLGLDQPGLGLAQDRVELRVDVLARLVGKRKDGDDRLAAALRARCPSPGAVRRLLRFSLSMCWMSCLSRPVLMAARVDPRLLRAANVFGSRAAGQQGRDAQRKGGRSSKVHVDPRLGEEVARRYHVQ